MGLRTFGIGVRQLCQLVVGTTHLTADPIKPSFPLRTYCQVVGDHEPQLVDGSLPDVVPSITDTDMIYYCPSVQEIYEVIEKVLIISEVIFTS